MSEHRAQQFMAQMLANLDASARAIGREGYSAQSVESCVALYELCVRVKPKFVLDVGTAAGASCLALAYALHDMGKDPTGQLLTVGIQQSRWRSQGIAYNGDLARRHGIEMKKIPIIEGDFRTVTPPNVVRKGEPTFVFYDIHDYDDGSIPPSRHLLDVWLPRIKEGIVAVHDAYTPQYAERHMAHAEHFGLGVVYGRREIVPIVGYLNEHRGQLFEIPGSWIVYFCVEAGEVV